MCIQQLGTKCYWDASISCSFRQTSGIASEHGVGRWSCFLFFHPTPSTTVADKFLSTLQASGQADFSTKMLLKGAFRIGSMVVTISTIVLLSCISSLSAQTCVPYTSKICSPWDTNYLNLTYIATVRNATNVTAYDMTAYDLSDFNWAYKTAGFATSLRKLGCNLPVSSDSVAFGWRPSCWIQHHA